MPTSSQEEKKFHIKLQTGWYVLVPSTLKLSEEKTECIVQILLLGRELEVDVCGGRGVLGARRITWAPKMRTFPNWDIMRNQITFQKELSMAPIKLITPALNQ